MYSKALTFDDLDDYLHIAVFAYFDLVDRITLERTNSRFQQLLRTTTTEFNYENSKPRLDWEKSEKDFQKHLQIMKRGFDLVLNYPNVRHISLGFYKDAPFPSSDQLIKKGMQLAECCPNMEHFCPIGNNLCVQLFSSFCENNSKNNLRNISFYLNELCDPRDCYSVIDILDEFNQKCPKLQIINLTIANLDWLHKNKDCAEDYLNALAKFGGKVSKLNTGANVDYKLFPNLNILNGFNLDCSQLTAINSLRVLNLNDPINFSQIGSFDNLKELSLMMRNTSDDDLQAVKKLIKRNYKTLTSLTIAPMEMKTTEVLARLSKLEDLMHEIEQCTNLTFLSVTTLCKGMLRHFDFKLDSVENWPKLRSVKVNWTFLNPDGLKLVLDTLPKIRYIMFYAVCDDYKLAEPFQKLLVDYARAHPKRKFTVDYTTDHPFLFTTRFDINALL